MEGADQGNVEVRRDGVFCWYSEAELGGPARGVPKSELDAPCRELPRPELGELDRETPKTELAGLTPVDPKAEVALKVSGLPKTSEEASRGLCESPP